jgi:hypothetical protein
MEWIHADGADRAAFERQGGFVNSSVFPGSKPKWQPRSVIDVAAMPSVNTTRGVTNILRGLQAIADGHAHLSHEVLNLKDGTPDWFTDAAPNDIPPNEDQDPIPRGSLLHTRPVAYEPLREYCKAALSRCDEDALSIAVNQWVRWGVDGYTASRRRKRRRTENCEPDADQMQLRDDPGSQDVEGESKGGDARRDDAPQVKATADQSENEDESSDEGATHAQISPADVMSDVLLALIMNRRDMLLNDRFGDVAKIVDEASVRLDDAQDQLDRSASCSLTIADALALLRGTTKVLRDAVHRQRRVVRRFSGTGLEGLVAHHAKEANSAPPDASVGEGTTYPSLPLLNSVREQHGRVIAAHDALADAQARFTDAHRAARIALEDAAEAARLIDSEQQSMDTLLRAAALECNAVDEVRQILVQELRSLKKSLPAA